MAKKKKFEIPPLVKYGLISACAIAVGFVVVNRTLYAFKHIDYFKIQSVVIDPSLQFINKRDLRNVIGKNIFAIDLKGVQRILSRKYPQASDLRINRHFPNQISVIAKQRLPFAQIQIQDQTVILDKEGVILELQSKKDSDLPSLTGTGLKRPKLTLGLPLRGSDLALSLRIIRLFKGNESLSIFTIESINISNRSKIYCKLTNGIDVILDKDKTAKKIRDLGVVLTQDYLTLKDIDYVDLRFKDPLIGKK